MMNPARLARYALAGWLPGGPRICALCNHHVWRFMPYKAGARGVPPLMHAVGVIGSNVDQFECPRCGAHDRERHLLLYLRASGILEAFTGKSVLHFAPEKRLSRHIRAAQPGSYVPCDLFPQDPGVVRVDMLHIQFDTDSFDVVIANHVLEHVDDEQQALAEVHRVLKRGGLAILQTPYSAKLQRTWQDAGVDDAESRLQAYGQSDHVRLFGRDIFDRIAAAGFESNVRQHDDLLDDIDPVTAGVNPAEPFFLFRKSR